MARGLNVWIFVLLYSAACLAAGTDAQRRAELEPVLRLLASPKASDRKDGETELFKLKDLERSEAVLKLMVDSAADPSHLPALLAFARMHRVLHQGEDSPIVAQLVGALQNARDPETQIALLETPMKPEGFTPSDSAIACARADCQIANVRFPQSVDNGACFDLVSNVAAAKKDSSRQK